MIGTWNARTLLQTGNFENVIIEMKRLKIDILGICDIRLNGQDDFVSGDYSVIYSGGDNGKNEVGIILNTKWAQRVRSHIAHNDRLIMVKLKSVPTDIAIIQVLVYLSTTQANDDGVEEIYEKLEELIKLTNGKENLSMSRVWNYLDAQIIDGITHLIIEGLIEETRSRGRPRMKYIS